MVSGAVLGVGIDLVETEHMREVLARWGDRFKNRVFLPGEQRYCEARASPFRHYAGRFAVKEAVTKAFGTGISPHIAWLDIEVVHNPETGAPFVRLSERARALARARGAGNILISLAHTRNYAVAQALLLSA
ncbi:MAG: holo-ACP synthase [Kiritimatiellae bacterium]|nr:holo-ACP synthase [Kiritimatiellia bacterium]